MIVLGGPAASGTISISADDFAEVIVNGVLVGAVGSTTNAALSSAAQNALTKFNITGFLRPGANTITIHGKNGIGAFANCSDCTYSQQPAGVVFGGSITASCNGQGNMEGDFQCGEQGPVMN